MANPRFRANRLTNRRQRDLLMQARSYLEAARTPPSPEQLAIVTSRLEQNRTQPVSFANFPKFAILPIDNVILL
jgi:hypothetical protein